MKRYLTLIALLIFCFTAKAQDKAPGKAQDTNKNDHRLAKSMELLLSIFREANMYYVDSINPEKMLIDATLGMFARLDPYTEYIPSSSLGDFEAMTTGRYGGVGSTIRQKNSGVEISEPYKGSPADKAGLKAGDRIVAIDGIMQNESTSQKVSTLLRGEPGTYLTVTYVPLSDTLAQKEVRIRREHIFQPSVSYYGYLENGIGYIRLDTFIEDGIKEVRDAITNLEKQGELKGLILDLRSNSGGIVNEAVKIAALFVPKNTEIVSLKGKIEEFNTKSSTKTAPLYPDLPLAILQSNVSASASEILAGALQDLDRAVIVGQRSFGKGLVQSPRYVGYDSYLKVTTAKYLTPSGRSIQALDYTNRKEDGSVSHIPDSLMSEFQTKAGRKVYSGGGIQPDIVTDPNYFSKFTTILMAYGFIDDFSNLYAAYNPIVGVDKFELNDRTYSEFIEFMRDKPIEYESGTAHMLKELKVWAEREKYDDRLQEEFASIERKITEDKISELRTFETEIKEVLVQSILNRWHYEAGSIEYSVKKSDADVRTTCKLLQDVAEYTRILTEQDTTRK